MEPILTSDLSEISIWPLVSLQDTGTVLFHMSDILYTHGSNEAVIVKPSASLKHMMLHDKFPKQESAKMGEE